MKYCCYLYSYHEKACDKKWHISDNLTTEQRIVSYNHDAALQLSFIGV